MTVSDLVKFCHSKHDRATICDVCPNECQGECEECLDVIHFDKIKREYNCSNITYFYVCKYAYKYSSEIDYLFSPLKAIHNFPSYDIMSIGCGPCTELLGILSYMLRERESKDVTYVGFDINRIWEEIHDYLRKMRDDSSVDLNFKFIYGDAFKIIQKLDLKNLKWRPNILILQYVISDMVKRGGNVGSFLKNIVSQVIRYMPIVIYSDQ